MELNRKRDYSLSYEWILSPLPLTKQILACASLLLHLLESLPFSSSPKLFFSLTLVLALSLSTSQKFVTCVNEYKTSFIL